MGTQHDRDRDINKADKPAGGPANRDPITKTPGAHPVGTGIGAAGGGAAGAAIGAIGGPIGAAVGAAVGAVTGGLGGKAAAEAIDPTVEDTYWSENYRTRPYAASGVEYKDVRPAYQYGWETAARYKGKPFSEVESELSRDWATRGANCPLDWNKARPAVRDAWERVSKQ